MSGDYILMKDKRRCPGCGVRRHFNPGNCHNCGMKLFTDDTTQDFSAYEDGTGNPTWWAYSRERGWVYRDFYMIPEARPHVKRFEIEKLDANYGKTETPDSVRAKKAQITRHVKKERTRVKPIKI